MLKILKHQSEKVQHKKVERKEIAKVEKVFICVPMPNEDLNVKDLKMEQEEAAMEVENLFAKEKVSFPVWNNPIFPLGYYCIMAM